MRLESECGRGIHGHVVIIGDGGSAGRNAVFGLVFKGNRAAKRLRHVDLDVDLRCSHVTFRDGDVGNANVGHREVAEVRVLELLALVQVDPVEAFAGLPVAV